MTSQAANESRAFARAAQRIMQAGPPSAGDDLLGMEYDLHAYLSGLDEVAPDSVQVTRTTNQTRLLQVTCVPSAACSLALVGEAVRRTWLNYLRYGFAEAHVLTLDDVRAELRWVTQIGPGEFWVTGSVLVAG